MSNPTLADIRALAFRLAPSGQNRNPVTGAKPTKADLGRLADLILELDLREYGGASPSLWFVGDKRLRELLKEEA
jgi:hypothetical protein